MNIVIIMGPKSGMTALGERDMVSISTRTIINIVAPKYERLKLIIHSHMGVPQSM